MSADKFISSIRAIFQITLLVFLLVMLPSTPKANVSTQNITEEGSKSHSSLAFQIQYRDFNPLLNYTIPVYSLYLRGYSYQKNFALYMTGFTTLGEKELNSALVLSDSEGSVIINRLSLIGAGIGARQGSDSLFLEYGLGIFWLLNGALESGLYGVYGELALGSCFAISKSMKLTPSFGLNYTSLTVQTIHGRKNIFEKDRAAFTYRLGMELEWFY